MRQERRAALATAAALGLLFAGCGGGSGSDASEPTTGAIDLTVKALDPGGKYSYDAKDYTAKAGTVNVALVNEGKENHNLLIQNGPKFKMTVAPGETKTGAVRLAAGTYTIYCDIAGHRDAGMEARLVVN
jgi:uncharacterized cupredoxin-like copper-binding protein